MLKRIFQKEIMDNFSIQDERIIIALNELNKINKYLGGNKTSEKGLKLLIKKSGNKKINNILDAGGGSSDILLSSKINFNQISNLDINPGINKYVKSKSPKLNIICSDIFKPPFKNKSFDIIHASLFFHHFKEDEIKTILIQMKKIAVYGIIINDLQRSIFAYMGIKFLTTLFSKSDMVKNDGPLSVRKGFTQVELIKLLNELNLSYDLKWSWAFRWLVVIYL